MYVILGRELIRQAVARTSERTYQGHFRCWKLFFLSVGLLVFLLAGTVGNSHLRSLLACIAYAWDTNGLTAGTIVGHLAVVKFFHHQEYGLELFLRRQWIVDALNGVTRSHAETRIKSPKRRPAAWSVLLAGESWCHQWSPGGQALSLTLEACFFFSTGGRNVGEQGRMLGIAPWGCGFFSGQYPTRLDNVGSG